MTAAVSGGLYIIRNAVREGEEFCGGGDENVSTACDYAVKEKFDYSCFSCSTRTLPAGLFEEQGINLFLNIF